MWLNIAPSGVLYEPCNALCTPGCFGKTEELLAKYGVVFQVISWTQGSNPKTYEMLWDLGVETFATDYAFGILEVMKSLKKK